MLSGPIYETGSIGWAKGGHGLAHTDLIIDRHFRSFLLSQDSPRRNYPLINKSPEGYQESPG